MLHLLPPMPRGDSLAPPVETSVKFGKAAMDNDDGTYLNEIMEILVQRGTDYLNNYK